MGARLPGGCAGRGWTRFGTNATVTAASQRATVSPEADAHCLRCPHSRTHALPLERANTAYSACAHMPLDVGCIRVLKIVYMSSAASLRTLSGNPS